MQVAPERKNVGEGDVINAEELEIGANAVNINAGGTFFL